MSTISSIYAQSASSLYESSSLHKTNSTSKTSAGSAYSGQEDSLNISDEAWNLLQQLQETESSDAENNSATSENQNKSYDFVSVLEQISSSDQLTEEQKASLEEIINSVQAKLDEAKKTQEENKNSMDMMPPPPPPKPFLMDEVSSSSEESTFTDSSEDSSSYTINLDDLVSSGLITQDQANTIYNAYISAISE
jgi:hypothetical protein